MMNVFYFVTGNKNKFKEAKEIFKPLMVKQARIHVNEIQSFNLNEICKSKVLQAYSIVKKPVFVEDVSLEINALNKFPGPFIKWVEETIGNKGILKLLEGKTNRKAIAKAMVCFYDGKRLKYFQGVLKGKIALKEKGKAGNPFRDGVKVVIFFVITLYGWLLFRSQSFSQIAALSSTLLLDFGNLTLTASYPRAAAMFGLPIFFFIELSEYFFKGKSFYKRLPAPIWTAVYACLICCFCAGMTTESTQFIYFQF